MSKRPASDTSHGISGIKLTARTAILCAAVLALSATALFAQVVGVELRQPVAVPTPPTITTGPDADKDRVAKRWENMPDAPKQDAAGQDTSKTQTPALPDAPK